MTTSVDGQVTVRQIAKTFASGRSAEKYFYSIMSDCGLPSGKVMIFWYTGCLKLFWKYVYVSGGMSRSQIVFNDKIVGHKCIVSGL